MKQWGVNCVRVFLTYGSFLTEPNSLCPEGLAKFDRRKWDAVKPEGGLGPLFTLLGAVGDDLRPRVVDQDYAFGGFSMTTVAFEPHQG